MADRDWPEIPTPPSSRQSWTGPQSRKNGSLSKHMGDETAHTLTMQRANCVWL
ncbi:unnamed protein product [Pipistrellus nathusii]|uniref:Uncharacterized protein n=1 Tax=Pipistrellus nathusii TaxID=59473 RepID=A0ABN9ZM57_PIPNA